MGEIVVKAELEWNHQTTSGCTCYFQGEGGLSGGQWRRHHLSICWRCLQSSEGPGWLGGFRRILWNQFVKPLESHMGVVIETGPCRLLCYRDQVAVLKQVGTLLRRSHVDHVSDGVSKLLALVSELLKPASSFCARHFWHCHHRWTIQDVDRSSSSSSSPPPQ